MSKVFFQTFETFLVNTVNTKLVTNPENYPNKHHYFSSKLGVVSTPIHCRRSNLKGTMSRHVSSVSAEMRTPAKRYGPKYLLSQDHATFGDEAISADDHISGARSPDASSNLSRVRSMEGGRTKSRERHESSNFHEKHYFKGHDSKERHKPSRKISIDPKLRNQIIEEAVRKARERQLSRSRERSKSKSHGAKVERSDTEQQMKTKSSGINDQRSKNDKGKLKDRKSPTGKHCVAYDSDSVSRERTPDDIEEWLKWRCYLNHQLSMCIVKGNSSRASVPVDIMSVPEKLNKDTRSAIWYHAQKERPKTSLDSNAYIVYGIPRARLRPNAPNFQISHYAVPSKDKSNQDPKRPLSPGQNGPEEGLKLGQVPRNYMSPRDLAQERGLTEKRPPSPMQSNRPVSPKAVVGLNSPGLSCDSITTQRNDERPLSPSRLSGEKCVSDEVGRLKSPNISDSRKELANQSGPLGVADGALIAGCKPALQPVGPANLREMYKKPFLRTLSEQSFNYRPSSPRRQISDPAMRNRSPARNPMRPISPLALFSEEPSNIDTTHDGTNLNNQCRIEQMSPKRKFAPKTLYAKQPMHSLMRTNTDVTTHSDDVINQTQVTMSDNLSKMTGYINVPSEFVEDRSNQYGCYARPPTPPPLPPKSFHIRK